ncbi:MAG: histidine phosphatase family protein [Nanoarchaeota archaeon]|nr:histidine phosphatase family protein [Nanoarchaeota archaeon]
MENTLYLLRHGKTKDNQEHRLIGVVDKGLSEEGVLEAMILRDNIKKEKVKFDTVYSSPLRRAYDTALLALEKANPKYNSEGDPIFENGQLNLEGISSSIYDGEINIDDRIKERSFGHLAGVKRDEVIPKFGHLYRGQSPVWTVDLIPEGGESLQNKYKAIVDFLNYLNINHEDEHILISSHGGPIGLLKWILEGYTLNDVIDENKEIDDNQIKPPHGKLIIYESDGTRYKHTHTVG